MRALLALTFISLRRLAREGSVVRALVWPGMLCLGTMLIVAAIAQPGAPAPTAVVDGPLASALDSRGLPIVRSMDPRADLESGLVERALATDDAGLVMVLNPSGWARFSGRRAAEDLQVEAIARAHTGAAWRLELPPTGVQDSAQAAATARHGSLLLRILGMVFALYAVVLTVASATRDRDTAVLEALGTTPAPPWAPSAARGLAVGAGCGLALTVTALGLGGLLPVEGLEAQLPALWGAILGAVALGTLALGGTGRVPLGPWTGAPAGMTAPLRTSLLAASALGGLGLWLPALDWLPLVSLGGGSAGAGTGMSALLIAVVALTWSCRRVGRVGW